MNSRKPCRVRLEACRRVYGGIRAGQRDRTWSWRERFTQVGFAAELVDKLGWDRRQVALEAGARRAAAVRGQLLN
jgi:hypothetical protein